MTRGPLAMNNRQKRHRPIMAARRRRVAALTLRGLGAHAIHAALADPARGSRNPETGEPWSSRTIERDLAFLLKDWMKRAHKDIWEDRARQKAELREHRRSAWSQKELAEVRLSIGLEMKLTGTSRPERHELTGADGGPIEMKDVVLARLMANLERAYGEDADGDTSGLACG